jgi:hypothetical protein
LAFYRAIERSLGDSLGLYLLNVSAAEASFTETIRVQNPEHPATLTDAGVECTGGRDGGFDVPFW